MENGPINGGPLFVVSVTIAGSYLIWNFAHWSVENIHAYFPWLLTIIIVGVSWAIERAVAVLSAQSQGDE